LSEKVFTSLDQVSILDLAGRGVAELHDAATRREGRIPCLAAATALVEEAGRGDRVLIATGFTIARVQRGETDGPLGAAVIAEHLQESGVEVVMVTDPPNEEILRSVCDAVSLRGYTLLSLPLDEAAVRLESRRVMEEFKPSAAIAIERPGWNSKRIYHSMSGMNISHACSPLDILFQEASDRGVMTIGIGDGGNEIGMGGVRETVERFVPNGRVCKCPCGSGIAAVTETTHLVVGSISNLAGYALSASYAILKNIDYLHTGEDERRMIEAAHAAGAVDGFSATPSLAVDAVPWDIMSKLAEVIWLLVRHHKTGG